MTNAAPGIMPGAALLSGYENARFHDLRHPYVKCRTQYLETP